MWILPAVALSDPDTFQTDHHSLSKDHCELSLYGANPQKQKTGKHPEEPAIPRSTLEGIPSSALAVYSLSCLLSASVLLPSLHPSFPPMTISIIVLIIYDKINLKKVKLFRSLKITLLSVIDF